jgi:hypothetical protein
MFRMHFLDYIPIWAVYFLLVAMGLVAVELGYQMGKHWKKRHPDETDSHIGAMLGATLGLWAFLLATVVGIANHRFDVRRELVLEEANTIGTTYLRAGYLPEPYASESRELLREYANERLKLVELDTYAESRRRSEEIQPLLWALAQDMIRTQAANPAYNSYVDSLNRTIDLHESRLTALITARLPITIYLGMFIVAFLGLFMLGYQSGINGQRNWIVTLALILIFAGVMLLIIDLDRPWGGFLRVNQQPMIDLINSLGSYQ